MRGRKPKPTSLHIVEGTLNSTRHADRPAVDYSSSSPVAPFKLDTEMQEVWDYYIGIMPWNKATETDLFLVYCDMAADLRKHIQGIKTKYEWKPAMIAQFKSIGAELGVGHVQQMKMTSTDETEKDDLLD